MKLSEIVGIKDPNADVGIEVEVEGRGLIAFDSRVWEAKHDGSLRDGIEYVYKKPLAIGKVEESLNELKDNLKDAKLNFSFRTSVHVHVNCLDLEYDQLLNFIYLSTLMDSMLVNYCGEQRKTNRFCLRLSDAEGLIDVISPLFGFRKRPDYNLDQYIERNQVRYAAVNVESLVKFGTIEFRSMRGTLDKDVLLPWVETLVNIREYSKQFKDPQEVYYHLLEHGTEPVLKEVLGKHFDLFNYDNLVADFALNQSLSIELPFLPFREGMEIKLYEIARSKFNSEQLKEVVGTRPRWMYLKDLLRQGVLLDPILKNFFDWEEYIEYLIEYTELPGVEELLDDMGVEH